MHFLLRQLRRRQAAGVCRITAKSCDFTCPGWANDAGANAVKRRELPKVPTAGRASAQPPGQGRVDGGEGALRPSGCLHHTACRALNGQDRARLPQALRGQKPAQSKEEQSCEHKHFALIRLPAKGWQTGVFRLGVSWCRLNRLPGKPSQGSGLVVCVHGSRGHRPCSGGVVTGLNSARLNRADFQ